MTNIKNTMPIKIKKKSRRGQVGNEMREKERKNLIEITNDCVDPKQPSQENKIRCDH